ncbi:MAG: hypothetical protein FJY65_02170 [Calditrichaeota bacterium]|nr:hypothetical protein [Calditrichota bacterium]
MNRQITRKCTLSDLRDDHGYVPGTPEERIAMVWEITKALCALSPYHDAERRLQRHITRVIRREG